MDILLYGDVMARRAALILLLLGVFPALACHLPVGAVETPEVSVPDVAVAVQMTLDVMLQSTPAEFHDPEVVIVTPTIDPQAGTPTPLPPLPIVTVNAPTSVPTLDPNTFQYITQPGDTPEGLARRFDLEVEQIPNPYNISPRLLLPTGDLLALPNTFGSANNPEAISAPGLLLPDSEIVYSPAATDFSVEEYVRQAGGFLSTYTEPSDSQVLSGAQIVQRVADEMSINPRLLLAVLEYRSHWVLGNPEGAGSQQYPIGFYANTYKGLYKELILVGQQLTIGYYGWRSGKVTSLEYINGTTQRIHPTVNAGTAAVQYLFAKLYNPVDWRAHLYDPARFIAFYTSTFGDPWQRAARVGPMLPYGLVQPELVLPFPAGQPWTLTGGPHISWGVGSPWGGLDFAPAGVEPGCTVSSFWVTSAGPGVVVREAPGIVIVDLDGDGSEQTGWALLYMHIAKKGRVAVGKQVQVDDLIGHPSCEGGYSTGTHTHIARKYNGEWMDADGPLPFVLSGWTAKAGEKQYTGSLVKDDLVVTSRLEGSRTSIITR